MKFFSTNRKAPEVSFKNGVIKSLPSDNGLYFPEEIPNLGKVFNSEQLSLPEIGFETLQPFSSGDIPTDRLRDIVTDCFSFEIPTVEVEEDIYSLELFHGPTYAFKDVGARFLARCLGYFNETEQKEVTILVATSGDTGGAVASGFFNVPGVEVIILYPSGKVSELQEKQLTTLGNNITALEIDGAFDDCQQLVKDAFLDKSLNERINLSSANSINIARWIPQSIYYTWACHQLKQQKKLLFSVPSGNYGNIAAGILAKKMGANISSFIAASNANDVVPRYLQNGSYDPSPTIATYSNAMDVGKPSNFPRMLELYGADYKSITADIQGFTLDDASTLKALETCKANTGYLADPHGVIGYQALKELKKEDETGIFLETAHPCKFSDVIEKIDSDYQLPEFTKELMVKEKQSQPLAANFQHFKEYLLSR